MFARHNISLTDLMNDDTEVEDSQSDQVTCVCMDGQFLGAITECKAHGVSSEEMVALQGLLMLQYSEPALVLLNMGRSCSTMTDVSDVIISSSSEISTDEREEDSDPSPDYEDRARVKTPPRKRGVKRAAEETGCRTNKKPKRISEAAQQSSDFCRKIKAIPFRDLPPFEPPKDVFERFNGSTEAIRRAEQAAATFKQDSGSQQYSNGRKLVIPDLKDGCFPCLPSSLWEYPPALSGRVDNRHDTLSIIEQRFIAGFGGRVTQSIYQECKRRIFVCARWRTEEDGIFHNKESSQQCCAINVNLVSVMHDFFDQLKLFDRPWNLNLLSERPSNIQHLKKISEGRNGRLNPPIPGKSGKKSCNSCENVPIATKDLEWPMKM